MPETVTEQQHQRPWQIERAVLPQHTDHAGVMWHGSYLAWLEEARVDALRRAGLAYSDLSERGLELPVISLKIDYRQALLHGESVRVESWVLPQQGVKLPPGAAPSSRPTAAWPRKPTWSWCSWT